VPVQDSAVFRYGAPLHGLVDGGTLFLQTALTDPEEIWASLPASARAEMVAREIRLAALDTAALARAHSPRADLEVRMQGVALVGVFLRLTPFARQAGLDRDALLTAIRPGLARAFGKRGSKVVDANLAVIGDAYDRVIDVTAALGAEHLPIRSLTVLPPANPAGIFEEALP
jgi:pyruvate-ferredoxin/flavodoxin oxidoreductase